MSSNLVLNPDGSATWDVRLYIPNIADIGSTGVATITITPVGGWGAIQALAQGDPGLPPVFDSVTTTTLAAGQSATGALTLVDPGGPGEAAHYTLALGLPQGQPGAAGAMGHILGSSDFSNSPTVAGQVPVFDGSTHVAWATLHPVTPYYVVPGSAFTALTESSSGARDIVVGVTIPAQAFNYRPRISGDLEVTGAVGMRIDAEVRMGPQTTADATIASTGTLIGYGRGQESAAAVHLGITPYFGVAMAPTDSSPAAVVTSGTVQRIILSAVRQYGSAAWTTSQTLGELRIALDAV